MENKSSLHNESLKSKKQIKSDKKSLISDFNKICYKCGKNIVYDGFTVCYQCLNVTYN
jgi:hypothetical protein